MDENGKKNIKSNNKKIIILFMLIPIILIVEVLCFTGYRNYVSKRNADNNSKESYNEKKENIKKDKKDTNDNSRNTNYILKIYQIKNTLKANCGNMEYQVIYL